MSSIATPTPSLPRPARPRLGRRARWVALLVAGLLALVSVGACGASSSGSSAVGPAQAQDQGAASQAKGADAAAGTAAGAPEVAGTSATIADDRKIVTTVGMFLTVDDVRIAAAAVRTVAAGVGGNVLSETVNATPATPDVSTTTTTAKNSSPAVRQGNYGQLVLAVPPDKVGAALDQLSKLGVEVQRTSSSEDVTGSYVDLQARIDNMKASVAQVKAYLAQAKDLQQMVTLEAEVTRRQSDLDSLQGQLNALNRKTATSTITVTISSNPAAVPVEDSSGFLGGLKSGWKAFGSSLNAALTVLGVLLPWLVLIGAIGWPVSRWLRRQRAATAAAAPRPAYVPVGQPVGMPAGPVAQPPAQPQPAMAGASVGGPGQPASAPAPTGPAAAPPTQE